ncbi:MAG: hypothetical protein ACRDK5_02745, partial [Solirubrobacterales bacterium]
PPTLAGRGAVLDDKKAYDLLTAACEHRFATGFRLYLLSLLPTTGPARLSASCVVLGQARAVIDQNSGCVRGGRPG